jgi:parallel beta-helix repeat protein
MHSSILVELKTFVFLAFVLMPLSTAVVAKSISPVVSYPAETELLVEVDLPVHNIDSGKNFSTIQEAINDNETLDGHTILVDAGTYYEHVIVNKSVSLIGENRSTTIVDGNYTGTVMNLEANNVNITGFTIQKSGTIYLLECGIYFDEESIRNNVSHNIITNNYYGIVLLSSSNNSISRNNITANKDFAIWLEGSSTYNSISENNIRANELGILLTSFSNHNSIFENNITNNGQGITLMGSSNSTITVNNVEGNIHSGILLSKSSNNTVSRNNIANNDDGISLDRASNNSISRNNITNNVCGILSLLSSNNSIYNNNFVNNAKQVDTSDSTNAWDDSYPSGGNYWSNYNGTDDNQDGIGDSPYFIDTNNQDNYPLMGMFYDFSVEIELGQICHVYVISNSTVSNLEVRVWLTSANEYLQPGDEFIYYVVDGEEGSVGFCRIMVPRVVLNDSYVVLVDWHEVSATELPFSNSTHAYLYFTYNHSTHEVVIVPEFPSSLILPLFITTTLLAVIVYRRKHSS